VARLGALITAQTADNARLTQRNQRLEAEVIELRRGDSAVEERARADLGLIGPDETFYLFGGSRPAG
jgi:cell division protein FtsB